MKNMLVATVLLASFSFCGAQEAQEQTGPKRSLQDSEPVHVIVPSSVEYVEHMGTDLTIADAARVSFDKKSSWKNDEVGNLKKSDKRIINYLAKHNHWTPFGHCFATFRITAPIFVARQLMKHTVGFCWNEVSRRYVSHEPHFYAPEEWRGRPANMKQGSGGEPDMRQMEANVLYAEALETSLENYTKLVEGGVAPEQARMILPQSMMTTWYWSGSLMAWARMCKLRLDSHAQKETGDVARQINDQMKELFPYGWAALMQEVNPEAQIEELERLAMKSPQLEQETQQK